MLSARRKAIVTHVALGVALTIVAFFVARTIRSVLHEQPVMLVGENGMRHWEAARASFARGEGFPYWDRTTCGGGPGLADPESLMLSSLVAGLFDIHGDVMGRWYPTLAATLGILGVYVWCRKSLAIGRIGAFWAGVVFVASGFLSLQASQRMVFVSFMWIPWALTFARLGEKSLRASVLVGLVLALMVYEGGVLSMVQALLAILVVSAPRFFARDGGPRAVSKMLGVALVAFVLVAGVKLFPVLVQLFRWPTRAVPNDSLKWADFMPIFIDKERVEPLVGHRFGFSEYRAYVGPMVLGTAIAGAGISVILSPRRWGLVLLLVLGLSLTRGAYDQTAPFTLLFRGVGFSALAVPSRFVVLALLAIAAAGAIAIDTGLRLAAKQRGLAAVLIVVAAVGAWDCVVEAQKLMKVQGLEAGLPRPDPISRPYSLIDDPRRVQEFPARNVGTMLCERTLDAPHAEGLAIGPVPQARLDGPDVGALGPVHTTQNGYVFTATMSRQAVVHVNTSWDPDWSTNLGVIRAAQNGGLDLLLPAGSANVTLSYKPRGLLAGATATIVGLAGFLALLAWPWLARRGVAKRRSKIANATPAAPPSPA